MVVRVRLFAAVRDAAGTAEATVEPAQLGDLLAGLAERYGEPFARHLGACSVLIDGQPVRHDAPVDVHDGAELAILPPVSGGA